MTAAFVLSIAWRTALAAQSPSAIRLAFAFNSFLDSPTEPGSMTLCATFKACNSETSAPVLSRSRAVAEGSGKSSPDRHLVRSVRSPLGLRRHDAGDRAVPEQGAAESWVLRVIVWVMMAHGLGRRVVGWIVMSSRTLQAKCSHVDHRPSPDQDPEWCGLFQQNRRHVLIRYGAQGPRPPAVFRG